MTKEELEAFLRTLDLWVIGFGIMVAIGVAGEAVVGFMHFRKSGELHKLQTAENLAQRAEIARLNKEAKEAAERATGAEVRAAEANRRTEEERLARMKIEERLAWRRVSPGEHDVMVSHLAAHAGAVVEVTKLGDVESATFSDDIIKTLRDAGWAVRVIMVGVMSPPPYGLQCAVNEQLSAGRALAAALKSLPNARVENAPGLPVVARMLVGLRPPP
jgi:hypothetical protein